MADPKSVTITAHCDRCPNPDATWHGTRVAGDGTAYAYIVCPGCGEHGPESVVPEKERVA